MWSNRDGDADAIQPPSSARTRVPFREHGAPQSMGDDAYINQPAASSSRRRQQTDAASDRTTSTTGLRAGGAAMGGRSSSGSSERDGEVERTDAVDQAYKAGMPIGFLAALGTPYAKKPLYRSKKCRVLCPILGLVTAAVAILLLVFPILRGVALHTLSTSVLSVTSSNITRPTNSSFGLTLEGQARKVGIFPAKLYFERPVDVYWIAPENLGKELHLGQFALEPIGVAAGHGRIKQQTNFQILNEAGFARFTEYLITQEEFTWRLKSESVQAKAFGFIAASGLSFVKDLTLPGMANMTDISIADFQLPGDDPAGGITLSVVTKLTNPSAFGVEIGTLRVGLYYEDLYLGPAQTAQPINLTAGVNTIHLVGRMMPYTDNPAALAQLSTLFSNYLNGVATPVTARGLDVTLPNGETIAWLKKGIQALVLNVPLQSPTGRISPIQGITIEALSLAFDPATAYAPAANSSKVSAAFGLPFGFSLNIVQLANQFAIVSNRTAVATLEAPMGDAQTTLLQQNAGGTSGTIRLDLPVAPLGIGPSYTEHLAFDQFTYDLTTTNGSEFLLLGQTTAVTNTPIGQVKLVDIGFTVPAGLIGLESLATNPTTILSVDVVGGTVDSVILAINVGLTNPSNLDLTVGNVTFQLFNGDSFLGTTVLPDLHLTTGYQEHLAVGYFQANSNPVALQTLTDFAQGANNDLAIRGFNGSTETESLTQAFMALNLNATLQGLTTKLLNYANLTVLDTTGVTNNFASSTVSLANPFTSPLQITNIQSNITSYGLFVGSITVDTDFAAAGKASSDSPLLNFGLNLFPPDIFSLLRALVVDAGMDPTPLDGVVALGGYTYTPSTGATPPARLAKRDLTPSIEEQQFADQLVAPSKAGVNPGAQLSEHMVSPDMGVGQDQFFAQGLDNVFDKRNLAKRGIYDGFDLPSYVLAAFKLLTVDVDLVSVLHIGDFVTSLAYRQTAVPAYTDTSLTLLLPILARPIVQKIVDAAFLGITTVTITDPSNTAFTAGLVGAITNAGPFDAVISFPQGLTVAWNGAPLGQIAMPEVSLVADVGATLDISSAFSVADVGHLSDFTGYLLTEPSFTWQIYGQELSVAALGITVGGISISKDVVLDGMNGFKGLVTIESFDLPANDLAGGISLVLQTSLTNPSSVGVALSTIGFVNSFGSTIIGPASSTAAFVLLPKTTISLPLAGRLIPQDTETGLADVSTIFNGFIHGVPSDLIVRGDTAGPADCTWLNEGIKKLAIAVVLPAAQNLEVINSITINEMTLLFTEESAYAPSFSTSNTVALFQLPFAFPVDITQIATGITAGDPGSVSRKRDVGDFAVLDVPLGPSDTDVVARTLLLTFSNVPFTSMDNGIFSNFLRDTTAGTSKTFALHGSADTVTSTAIGNLNLADIGFSVSTSILGLQGLNARPATVSELDVFRGFSDFLQINVNANLFNPSNITIGTGDVAFGLSFNDQIIGTANIANLILVPGENIVPTAVHYEPSGGAARAAGQLLLENFIQAVPSDTLIIGNSGTTPIGSLKDALGTIQLATTIPPLEQNLITQANLAFPIDIGTTGVADATVSLGNPFSASINLVDVLANATFQGLYLGQVNVRNLNPYITAPGRTAIISPTLPLALNIDPKALIRFVQAAALAQGVDLGILLPQFEYVLGLESTESSITTSVNLEPETCNPTGTTAAVQALILASVKDLRTDLTIESLVRLDEFQTPLNFVQRDVPTVLDDSVLYLTGILGKTIVSRIVEVAELSFSGGMVTNVTDRGFSVALKGSLLNAGPFDASIEFPFGVDVIWEGSKIATIALPPICAAGGSGVPDLDTVGILTISDESRFEDFATAILLEPGFTWTITTDRLRVKALGTIFDDVTLTKDVSFSAFNGLPGVTIVNPDFPGDAPNGIQLVTDSTIPSPSNLGIELGHVSFIARFMGEVVGPIDGFGLTLAPLATTSIQLTGTIIKRTSAASTASLGVLFSQFLAGANQTLNVVGQEVTSPAQPNSPVKWLSAAFKKLTLDVVLPGQVYDIISSIKLQDLTVSITQDSESYAVPTQNNQTDVIYRNPFGFSLRAKQAGGAFFINHNGVDAGVLTLPLADAVLAETSTGQDARLVLDFKDKQILRSLDTGAFNEFFNVITNTPNVDFVLRGAANVTAETNAGDIPITGIPFSVNTNLLGLESLNARPTVVSNLDVFRGFSDYLQINADASLFNPSNITIITNEVVFGLLFDSQIIGSVVIGDLLLIPGSNNLGTEVRYAPTGGASTAAGQLLLENFVQAVVSDVAIVGTPNTTPYGSLSQALGTIVIQTSIPPLEQLLITRAALSFPIDIATTSIAQAKFDLSNPFSASINLINVVANATYKDFFLGQINSQNLDPRIRANGKQNITSRNLPFFLTTDPKFLISFLQAAAADQGVDLGILLPQFAYVLSLPSTDSLVTSSVNLDKETCAPTGTTKAVQGLILAAVANLKTDLLIASTLALDEYETDLNFIQRDVPTELDDSVLYLTGLLGKTIVSNIVDVAKLAFTGGSITNVTDSGFTVALVGSLLDAGPFDALIEFPAGLDVIWEGTTIASIQLPPICSPGGTSVPNLETTGVVQITNLEGFTTFASFILLNPSFTWTVTTTKLRVKALGTIFDNVTLTKEVSFQAFNKLAPGVTVSNPDFPGDAPNGIRLSLDSLVPSPSNLGIILGDVSFIASFDGSVIGPVNGQDLTLPAMSPGVALPLTGVITQRSDPAGLQSLGKLFSQFLRGEDSILQVAGNEVVSPAQPGSPVKWLSDAFKTLVLEVVLPGQEFEIISAITLQDLIVSITEPSQAYAALIQNNVTNVVYRNPFGFSLQAIQAGGNFIIDYAGGDAALLTLPVQDSVSAEVSTGNSANLVLAIREVAVLSSLNNGGFDAFFTAITNDALVNFDLHGGANVTGRTAAGDIPISGIPFRVSTSFEGIQGFNGVATIPAIPIVIGSGSGDQFNPSPGGSSFIRITLDVILSNPAPLILHTNLVSLEIVYRGTGVGRAYIDPLDLYLGSNTIATEFHYQPADPSNSVAQDLLTQYLSTTGPITLTVLGDGFSSPYGSLAAALSPIELATSFPGQGIPLIDDIKIFLDPIEALCSETAMIQTSLNNNLGTSITLLQFSGTAKQDGTTYATFDHTFQNSFRTNAGETPGAYSEMIPVTLTQGILKSVPLLFNSAKGLDISIVARVAVNGYVAPSLVYMQLAVPYSITPTLDGLTLSPDSLSSIASNPLQALGGLLGELASLTTCVGGVLSLLPGNFLDDLTALPNIITSLIGGIPRVVEAVEGTVCNALPEVCAAVGLDGGDAAAPTDLLPTGLACILAPALCTLLGLTGGVATSTTAAAATTQAGAVVPAVVAGITSALDEITSAIAVPSITSVVAVPSIPDVVAPVTSLLGGLLGRALPTPTPTIALPRDDFGALNSFLAFDSFESAAAAQPTAPPSVLMSPNRLSRAAAHGGISPGTLQKLLVKHGFTVVEELEDSLRRRDRDLAERRRR